MALYTQFQDPGLVQLQRTERQDENLRGLLGTMMKMKQDEMEWRQQQVQNAQADRRLDLAEERNASYDKYVQSAGQREQSQWEARMAVARMRWPTDLDKQQRYLLGEPAEDIDWTIDKGYSQEEQKRLAEFTGTTVEDIRSKTRDDLKRISADMTRGVYGQPNAQRQDWLAYNADIKGLQTGRSDLLNEAKKLRTFISDSERAALGGLSETQRKEIEAAATRLEEAAYGLSEIEAMQVPGVPMTQTDRMNAWRRRNIKNVKERGYWWITEEEMNEFRRKWGLSSMIPGTKEAYGDMLADVSGATGLDVTRSMTTAEFQAAREAYKQKTKKDIPVLIAQLPNGDKVKLVQTDFVGIDKNPGKYVQIDGVIKANMPPQ